MRTFLDKFFPIPDFLRMPAVGLDITDEVINYVELVNTNKGLGVGRFGKKTLEEGVIVKGIIHDTQKLQDVLTNLQRELEMHFARTAIPEQLVYSFVITIPRVIPREVRAAVEFQIEEHVPVAKRDLIFDYEILSEEVRSYRLKVNAVTRKVFEGYHTILQESGFNLVHFEPRPEATLRGMVLQGGQRNVVILDIGTDHSSISIVEDGKIISAASISFNSGGEGNIDMLREEVLRFYSYWHTSHPDAVAKEKDDKEDISHSKKESPELGQDQKYSEESEVVKPNNAMYPIVVCGNIEGLWSSLEKMSKQLETNIIQGDTWNAPTIRSIGKYHIPKEDLAQYTTAIGLALSDF